MVNFPVVGGTSGHLVGGVLVAALLGPSAAIVVLTTALIVQCFLFADGGVLALGANVFHMAILGAAGGCAIYRRVCRWLPGTRGQVAAVTFAGWCSTVLAALSHSRLFSAGRAFQASMSMRCWAGGRRGNLRWRRHRCNQGL